MQFLAHGEQVGGRIANEIGILDDLPVLVPALLLFAGSLAKPMVVLSSVRSS